MNLLSVRCQSCGAPLQVGETARFVTCQFCHTELTVERTDSAVFTQKIEEIHAHTAQMAGSMEVIRIQNDLEKLDREWLLERERYMVTGKHGSRHEPGMFASLFGGVAVMVVGLVWVTMATTISAPSFFPVIGLVILGLGLVSAATGFSKASAREEGRVRYERTRAAIVRRLDEVQKGGG